MFSTKSVCGFEETYCIEFWLAASAPERYHCQSVAAKLGPLVDRAARELGGSIDARTLDAVERWLERLQAWNARMDLTAARSPSELVDLMVADALVLATRIPQGARMVDIGTGAGAPGLALALLRPDLAVTLVEPLGKRTAFLRSVIGELERADVVLERKRGEAFAGRRDWDTAISRATLGPSAWLDLGTTLVRPGGGVWTLLAKDAPPAHPQALVEDDFAYAWPLTRAVRRAVLYRVE
jgi:16S rRNA (guanine527-N7)-methyltransferase